jgi:hypothetical protein
MQVQVQNLATNPFYSLGLEKSSSLSVDRLLAAYNEAKQANEESPSNEGRAYVAGLHSGLDGRGVKVAVA